MVWVAAMIERRWLFGVLFVIAILAHLPFCSKASAQVVTACMPERNLLSRLARKFNEHPVWRGQGYVGQVKDRQIVRTESLRGSWTIYSVENGRACILGAGTESFDIGFPS